ncbi:MAG: AAA family ATPase [Cellvibrionaceae bacterium]
MEHRALTDQSPPSSEQINLMPDNELSSQITQPPLSSSLFPDYVEHLGLEFDPFTSSPASTGDVFDLYLEAGRRELIDQVIYLAEFNAGALVVSGESGAGKSCLFASLPSQFDSSWASCSIDVSVSLSANRVFFLLAQSLGAQVSEEANSGELLAAIRHQLTQGLSDPFILLIDDAHKLEDSVLSALMSLLQSPSGNEEPKIHLVLFGDDELIVRLDGFAMVDVLLHDIPLRDFTLDDSADYLLQKLRSSGWSQALPFSERELNQLHQLSAGKPGGLHEPARELLAARVTVNHDQLDKGPGLPVAHMFSVVVLLGVLVMAYFYKDSWFGGDEPQVAVAPVIIEPAIKPPAARVLSEPSRPAPKGIEVADSEGEQTLADVSLEDEPVVDSHLDDSFDLRPPERPVDSVALEIPAVAKTESMTPTLEMKPSLAELPAPAALGAPESAVEQPSFNHLLSNDEQALMGLEGERFVLQVMAAGSKSAVEKFMVSQSNRPQLHMYTTWRQGKPWYVVVAGNYPTSALARKGVNELPSIQKKAEPWPRRVVDIQTKIKEFRRI